MKFKNIWILALYIESSDIVIFKEEKNEIY